MEFKLKDIRKNKLVIFDLDDTLVKTDATVKLISSKTGRIIRGLTPEQFNTFTQTKRHHINYEDFDDPYILRSGQIIKENFNRLKYYYFKRRVPVSILTARSSSDMVRGFFIDKGIDIHPSLVVAINDPSLDFSGSIPEKKQQAIKRFIDDSYTDLIFFDDNEENLRLAKEIEGYKNSRIKTIKVGA